MYSGHDHSERCCKNGSATSMVMESVEKSDCNKVNKGLKTTEDSRAGMRRWHLLGNIWRFSFDVFFFFKLSCTPSYMLVCACVPIVDSFVRDEKNCFSHFCFLFNFVFFSLYLHVSCGFLTLAISFLSFQPPNLYVKRIIRRKTEPLFCVSVCNAL